MNLADLVSMSVYLPIGSRVLDYFDLPGKDYILNVISNEFDGFLLDDQVIVVAAKNDL